MVIKHYPKIKWLRIFMPLAIPGLIVILPYTVSSLRALRHLGEHCVFVFYYNARTARGFAKDAIPLSSFHVPLYPGRKSILPYIVSSLRALCHLGEHCVFVFYYNARTAKGFAKDAIPLSTFHVPFYPGRKSILPYMVSSLRALCHLGEHCVFVFYYNARTAKGFAKDAIPLSSFHVPLYPGRKSILPYIVSSLRALRNLRELCVFVFF